MSPEIVWSLPRRIAFRFAFVAGVIYLFPFPLGMIPKTQWLADILNKPWDWFVPWFAETFVGVEAPKTMTGSGDTMLGWMQLLCLVLLGAIGAGVWSVLDRRRLAYPKLQAAALIGIRYFLAAMMLSYGFAKIFVTQFPPPSPGKYEQFVGEMSPMGLLWTFMGHSQPYTIFGGLMEALAGVLLLVRRTSVLGAAVAAAVMTNVVMLNFCYDVPVKLFSAQLLLLAVLILWPHARRLLGAMLGRAAAEVPPRTRGSKRVERARLVVKGVFLLTLAYAAYERMQFWREFPPPPMEIDGVWVSETFSLDGVERAPLTTDEQRWRRVAFGRGGAIVRYMNDKRVFYRGAKIDEKAKTITMPAPMLPSSTGNPFPAVDPAKMTPMTYTMPDRDHLVIEGLLDGKKIRATFARAPEPLLKTRGFHWVQEFPFNR